MKNERVPFLVHERNSNDQTANSQSTTQPPSLNSRKRGQAECHLPPVEAFILSSGSTTALT